MPQNTTALIVIDIQNDYFPNGKFPLWEAEEVLTRSEQAIALAVAQGMPVVLIQHVANPQAGPAPFFNADTDGVKIHSRILAAAPNAPIVIKHYADSFLNTTLAATLKKLGTSKLLLCGMMTQNCVTHTALSRTADAYQIEILADCCTTVSQPIHRIALAALAPRFPIRTPPEALAGQQ